MTSVKICIVLLLALFASAPTTCRAEGNPPRKGQPKILSEETSNSAPSQKSSSTTATKKGKASWYGPGFHGNDTANGERYDMYKISAAHKKLPFGTLVRITNLTNGKSVVVRINDRGPFVPERDFDLSYGAAKTIGMVKAGVVEVEYEILPKPPKKIQQAEDAGPTNS